MDNSYKKIAALIILLTLAGIIWHERLPGRTPKNIEISQKNPFTDIKEVPLKLDSLEAPDIDLENRKKTDKRNLPWGNDPFKAKQ